MYNMYDKYPHPYYVSPQMYDPYNIYPYSYLINMPMSNPGFWNQPMPFSCETQHIQLKDYGSNPYVVNIEKATKQNKNFRIALWTGKYLQLTLMSIQVGDDIGLEVHPDHDQFIRIEEGQGLAQMGDSKTNLDFQRRVSADYVIFVPAGKWHNLINTGNRPLKLYSIYAPPEHPFGTVHETKAIAEAAHDNHDQ
ncbi:UNVERIFIED_CONTAM: mannose-6-phosphate isomerase-like protein (cupin superfamily) [Acetivibrio alkalicellulosi]